MIRATLKPGRYENTCAGCGEVSEFTVGVDEDLLTPVRTIIEAERRARATLDAIGPLRIGPAIPERHESTWQQPLRVEPWTARDIGTGDPIRDGRTRT